jgi:hypothetical protein
MDSLERAGAGGSSDGARPSGARDGSTPFGPGGGRRPVPSTSGAVVSAMTPTMAAAFATSGDPRDQAAGATVIAHA